ncbi:MAG: beta-phosphoglucomutase [Gammaproteobacteria bacterium]|nr:beta-phosphoglucomutase [Gammaproteobacteria bacterium]
MAVDLPHGLKPSIAATGAASDGWHLAMSDEGPSGNAAQAETLFCLANGALGVRGGREEQPSATDGALLAGVFESVPIRYHEGFPGFARASDTRVPVADGKRIRVRLGAHATDVATGKRLACRRVLDLRAGLLSRKTRWCTSDGHSVEIIVERLVPLDGETLLALRFTVHSIDYLGPVALESCIEAGTAVVRAEDPRVGTAADAALIIGKRRLEGVCAVMTQSARRSGIQVAIAQAHRIAVEVTAGNPLFDDPGAVGQRYSSTLVPGGSLTIDKFVAWSSGPDPADLGARATSIACHAVGVGFDELKRRQSQAWAAFWRNAELGIDGEPSLDQALHFNLFHLRQSTPADGRTALAAKGLTGEGYEGHVFWDTEVFALPVLQMTAPELVRASLAWRHRTLERARAHAREMNHARGALFPWRTIAGDEASAYFPSGSAQYHINADVAYAQRLHHLGSAEHATATGNAETLFETARIWLQIGRYSATRGGAFCIYEVTGPDEYSALVDNDYYTNRMAQLHLQHAAEIATVMQRDASEAFRELAARIGLAATEPAEWRRAAAAMYLPVDPRLGVHPQDDSFLDKPPWPFTAQPGDDRPLLLQYHPLTLYRHQICKQPNVVLAHVLCGEGVPLAQKRRDFDYYEPLTVHDSSLSACSWCILAAELGHSERALRYFRDGARLDLDDLHGNASHGAHMAAMAGTWLSLVWGFAGLRVAGDGTLKFSPTLPAGWTAYFFTLLWRGRRLRVDVNAAGACYRLTQGEPLTLQHLGTALTLLPEAAITVPLTPPAQPRPARRVRAVIFDLDGVLTDTAALHYQAWKRLADEIGVPFDEHVNQRLKGVARTTSLDIILERATRAFPAEERRHLAESKDRYFRESIASFTPAQLLPGARAVLEALRARGIRIALASASQNAPALIERLGIAALFDQVVDPASVAAGKPAPDIFLAAAAALGVEPGECLAVEDAVAGVAAIKAANMFAVGIGEARNLTAADVVVPDVASMEIERFLEGT